jgi:hypothetical protein
VNGVVLEPPLPITTNQKKFKIPKMKNDLINNSNSEEKAVCIAFDETLREFASSSALNILYIGTNKCLRAYTIAGTLLASIDITEDGKIDGGITAMCVGSKGRNIVLGLLCSNMEDENDCDPISNNRILISKKGNVSNTGKESNLTMAIGIIPCSVLLNSSLASITPTQNNPLMYPSSVIQFYRPTGDGYGNIITSVTFIHDEQRLISTTNAGGMDVWVVKDMVGEGEEKNIGRGKEEAEEKNKIDSNGNNNHNAGKDKDEKIEEKKDIDCKNDKGQSRKDNNKPKKQTFFKEIKFPHQKINPKCGFKKKKSFDSTPTEKNVTNLRKKKKRRVFTIPKYYY